MSTEIEQLKKERDELKETTHKAAVRLVETEQERAKLRAERDQLEAKLRTAISDADAWKSRAELMTEACKDRNADIDQLEAKWKAAEDVLQGRCENIVTNPVQYACEQYIAAEDALPDCFDTEDYCLSRAVESLVKASERCDQLEAELESLLQWPSIECKFRLQQLIERAKK